MAALGLTLSGEHINCTRSARTFFCFHNRRVLAAAAGCRQRTGAQLTGEQCVAVLTAPKLGQTTFIILKPFACVWLLIRSSRDKE